jgi:sugar phosphate permease
MSTEGKIGGKNGEPVEEEGFKARSIALIGYLFLAMYIQISLSGPESMNLLLPALEREFGWNPPDVAVRISVVRLMTMVSMFLAGTLFIKFGIKKILIPCMVLAGLGIIGMGNSSTLDQFVWCAIVMNLMFSVSVVALGALTANWYVRKRGRVLGIITIAFPLSTATFTLIGTKTLEAVGYTGFYSGVGVVAVLVGLSTIWLIQDKPEDVGLSPDGIAFTETEKAEIAAREARQSAWSILRILKTKEIWAYSFVWAFVGLVLGGIMSQLIPVFTSSGISVNKALGMMSVAALAGMPLSYIWGWLDDKIGTPNTTAVFSLVLITGCLGMAYGSAENTFPYYLAIFCIALGTAGMPNLQPSLLAYMVGRKEFVNVSRYTNIIFGIFGSISMSFVPVTYAILGSYKPVFLSMIIFAVLGIILTQFCKKTFDPERQEFMEEGKIQ